MFTPAPRLIPLLLLSFTACTPAVVPADGGPESDAFLGADAPPATPPTVLSTLPESGASEVALNANARVTFSQPMNPDSLGVTTFTVTSGDPAVLALGNLIVVGTTATFWPSTHFEADTLYTATVTTGATNLAGVALEADYVWRFTSGNTSIPGLPLDLHSSGDFVILAESGVSTVPTSIITGDVGLSPAAATFVTGFSLVADASNVFSLAPQVTGMVYAADYAVPTPATLTTAVSDMERAYTDAAGRAPDITELGAGNVGGMSLARGVYQWGTGLTIPTDVTLTGSATDVWIFQIAGDLTMSSGARVVLAGGALASNVFWQVGGMVDLGTTAHCEGTLLSHTSIILRTGASVQGRLLAQTAVDLDGATVTQPE